MNYSRLPQTISLLIVASVAFGIEAQTIFRSQNAKAGQYPGGERSRSLKIPLDPARQKMMFRGEYYSRAWAYQQRGWYIDDKGNIYSYDYLAPRTHEVLETVRPVLVGHVAAEVLAAKRKLIPAAARQMLRMQKSEFFDVGVCTICAFIPEGKTGKLRTVELEKWGEIKGINRTPEARELLAWLDSIVSVPLPRLNRKIAEPIPGSAGARHE